MPNRRGKKLGEVKAGQAAKAERKATQAKAPKAAGPKKAAPKKTAAKKAALKKTASKKTEPVAQGTATPTPNRLVSRKGTVYLAGCDVPVWRLEMARRAGSGSAALIEAFPGLTSRGLNRAFAYAQLHRAEIDRLIRTHGPTEVPTGGEPDDGANFERELGELLDRDAALYRRLAR